MGPLCNSQYRVQRQKNKQEHRVGRVDVHVYRSEVSDRMMK